MMEACPDRRLTCSILYHPSVPGYVIGDRVWALHNLRQQPYLEAAGLGAVLTCVDPKQLSERFVGRHSDAQFLSDLPAGVDPCGERGEFPTFCH
jgi:hypothetical protein